MTLVKQRILEEVMWKCAAERFYERSRRPFLHVHQRWYLITRSCDQQQNLYQVGHFVMNIR